MRERVVHSVLLIYRDTNNHVDNDYCLLFFIELSDRDFHCVDDCCRMQSSSQHLITSSFDHRQHVRNYPNAYKVGSPI